MLLGWSVRFPGSNAIVILVIIVVVLLAQEVLGTLVFVRAAILRDLLARLHLAQSSACG